MQQPGGTGSETEAEERRGFDGQSYTRQEFLGHFGDEQGAVEWDKVAPSPSTAFEDMELGDGGTPPHDDQASQMDAARKKQAARHEALRQALGSDDSDDEEDEDDDPPPGVTFIDDEAEEGGGGKAKKVTRLTRLTHDERVAKQEREMEDKLTDVEQVTIEEIELATARQRTATARATRAVKNLEKNQQKHTNEVELNYDALNMAIDDAPSEDLKSIIETILEKLADMPVDDEGEERVVLTQAEELRRQGRLLEFKAMIEPALKYAEETTALATTIRKLRAAEEKARRQHAARGTRKKEDTRSARDVMNQIKQKAKSRKTTEIMAKRRKMGPWTCKIIINAETGEVCDQRNEHGRGSCKKCQGLKGGNDDVDQWITDYLFDLVSVDIKEYEDYLKKKDDDDAAAGAAVTAPAPAPAPQADTESSVFTGSVSDPTSDIADIDEFMSKTDMLYKTKMCIKLPDCPFGDRCRFAHSEEELRQHPIESGTANIQFLADHVLHNVLGPVHPMEKKEIASQVFEALQKMV